MTTKIKTKRCQVHYHQISKTLFHRVCIWPDRSVTVSKVKITDSVDGPCEKTLELYKPHK